MTTQQISYIFSKVQGATIVAAYSSLSEFSCLLDNQKTLLLQAVQNDRELSIEYALVEENQLRKPEEAVCKVDWSWITGGQIAGLTATADSARFTLNPAGPLTVTVLSWQGKPFLSFQPFRA